MVNYVKKMELREVEVTDHTEIICDCCGKLIFPIQDNDERKLDFRGRAKYYHARSGHHDWGNDSIDSLEYLDFCSLECVHKQLDKFYKEDEPYSDTAYFEIEAESTPEK